MTNFPGGLTSFGVPVLGNALGIPIGQGIVAFVGSAQQTAPFAIGGAQVYPTLQGAVNAAPEGSVIFAAPGSYVETVTVSEDYITLIQLLGAGYGRPDVVPATGPALIVHGQGFTSVGMRYAASDDDAVRQHGNGFQYFDNVFDGSAGQAATEACLRLVGAVDDSHTASEGIVDNNLFRGSTSGAGIIMQWALAAAGGAGTTDNRITRNRFVANGIDLLTATNVSGGGAGIFQRLLLAGNWFMTVGAGYVYADMNQGGGPDLAVNSGLFSGNFFADESLAAAQFVLTGQANAIFTGNWAANGIVDGTAFN